MELQIELRWIIVLIIKTIYVLKPSFEVMKDSLHDFGLDTGTLAEGWINLMFNFRKNHM